LNALAVVRWLLVFGPFVVAAACSRNADIVDEPDASVTTSPTFGLDADIQWLDAGLATDAYSACSARPFGDCVGTNDFPCGMALWVKKTATACHEATDCEASGWLQVRMNAEGCVSEIGMEKPHDGVIACLLAEFGAHRCPCQESVASYVFIPSPDCTPPCGSGEFPCPPGLVCNAEQKCVKP
jgi:hypothetical protein